MKNRDHTDFTTQLYHQNYIIFALTIALRVYCSIFRKNIFQNHIFQLQLSFVLYTQLWYLENDTGFMLSACKEFCNKTKSSNSGWYSYACIQWHLLISNFLVVQ